MTTINDYGKKAQELLKLLMPNEGAISPVEDEKKRVMSKLWLCLNHVIRREKQKTPPHPGHQCHVWFEKSINELDYNYIQEEKVAKAMKLRDDQQAEIDRLTNS